MLAALPLEFSATLKPETLAALATAYSIRPQTPDEFVGGRPIQAVEFTIPGFQGDEIQVIVFSRKDRTASASKAPGFYYLHGGGMAMGHGMLGAEFLLPWVEQFDGVVASVEYRLAPQHPDPTPVEDGYAGLVWFAAQGEKLGFDTQKIMLIGSSAGGGVGAGTTLLARDRGGPHIAWQLLQGPMLDDRNTTLSSRQYETLGVWNRTSNQTGWGALLGDRKGGPDVSIYAAPARATDLSNLPPTYLEVGSAEVFRDEVVAYANLIWAAGGRADLHVWAGGFHGYDMWPQPRLAKETLAARLAWVRRVLEFSEESGTYDVAF